MSDSYRRMLEDQERLRRLQGPASSFDLREDAFRHLGVRPADIDVLRQEEGQRGILDRIDSLAQHHAIDWEAARRATESPWEEATRRALTGSDAEFQRAIQDTSLARELYDQHFRTPDFVELSQLASEAMAASQIAQEFLAGSKEALERSMGQMGTPWLSLHHGSQSARAFADIVGIGSALKSSAPYDERFVAALRPSLGDWRDSTLPAIDVLIDPLSRTRFYREQGVDPAFSDLPVRAFEESARTGGLEEPEPAEFENDDEGFERAQIAYAQLRRFEVAIRRFIERMMHQTFGTDWMTKLPDGMLENWISKRDSALKEGREEKALIDYADFTDYKRIIEARGNWRFVFSAVFKRPEDIRESFQRLYPVRIATMHAGIVTIDDELLLRVETRRILKAIQQ